MIQPDSGKLHAEPEIIPEVEMRRRERMNIRAALRLAGWKIYGPGGAAELHGIKPTTLSSRRTCATGSCAGSPPAVRMILPSALASRRSASACANSANGKVRLMCGSVSRAGKAQK